MIDVVDLLLQRKDLETVFRLCLTSDELRKYCDPKCKLIDSRCDTIFSCYREWKTPLIIEDNKYVFGDCVLVNTERMLNLLLVNLEHKLQLEVNTYQRNANEILKLVMTNTAYPEQRARLYGATYLCLKELFWLEPRNFTSEDFPMLQLDKDFLLLVIKSDIQLRIVLRNEMDRKPHVTIRMYKKGQRILSQLKQQR